MEKEIINAALQIFDTPEKWNAFIDLYERKGSIQNVWINKAKILMKSTFFSDETWDVEFGTWWDTRWKLKSNGRHLMQFWLSWDGFFHFIINNDGTKGEIIKKIFSDYKYDPLRYIWGGDIQTNVNYEIKLKQEGKWYFDSPYDGDMKVDRLLWYAGNETEKFIRQIKERVNAFQETSNVQLLRQLQAEIDNAIPDSQI